MYFSRGNPVIYYGDEQGFTGPGGDQDARQSMFASRVPDYLDDDLLGTSRTHAQDNFVNTHPLYQSIRRLSRLTTLHPALRDGAHQHRYASDGPGIYAFSRVRRGEQREFVVALNNSEQPQTAKIPTYIANRMFHRWYGSGRARVQSAADKTLTLTVPPLSTVVYRSAGRIPLSTAAPAVTLARPAPTEQARSRIEVRADVAGSSFYEVTFYAKVGRGTWQPIGTDDTAPYRVFHDVSALRPGTPVEYRAVVQDNARNTATSAARRTVVPAPRLTIETPAQDSRVRGRVEVRAVADPDRPTNVVRFERRIAGGAWKAIGTDSSSPVYTVFDDISKLNLAAGTVIEYRATLTMADGTRVRSAIRRVAAAGPPATKATLRYFRPGGDYTGWGLHLWGDAVDPAVLAQISWGNPLPPTRIVDGWAEYDIPLVDDTKAVNFIMHLPNGDTVPTTREPGGDRSFLPVNSPDVWIVQGDPTIYTSKPRT
jgi:hypothetical protein